MSRSHDHWCPNCKAHFSPLDFPEGCPVCEHPGVYDPNDDYGTQAALEEVYDDGRRGHVAELAQAHGFDPAEFALETVGNHEGLYDPNNEYGEDLSANYCAAVLSQLKSPADLRLPIGHQAIQDIRRYMERGWSNESRYPGLEYSDTDPISRGQCGVTSAYLLEAAHSAGWNVQFTSGDLFFHDLGIESIPNHCWIEVATEDESLILDLTIDQTGFSEKLVIDNWENLRSLGAEYVSHSRTLPGIPMVKLEPRLAALKSSLASAFKD